jgi:putative ABC transport system permease protein
MVFSLASNITEEIEWMQVRITQENIHETIDLLEKSWENIVHERPFNFVFMDDVLERHYVAEDQFLNVFTTFSIISILLGGLGLFGLSAYMMKLRTKEIGLRRILGAPILKLIQMLSGGFLKMVAIASLIGWPIAYFLMDSWLQNFAYKVSISVWIFLGTGFVAMTLTFIVVLYHALIVSRSSPIKSLRYE